LLLRHVDANDRAGLSNQLAANVSVSTGSTAQIETGTASKIVSRQTQTASIVLGQNLRVNVLQAQLNVRRRSTCRRACVCLEILLLLKCASVVLQDIDAGCFVHFMKSQHEQSRSMSAQRTNVQSSQKADGRQPYHQQSKVGCLTHSRYSAYARDGLTKQRPQQHLTITSALAEGCVGRRRGIQSASV
jgi:hypothetical protein